MTVGELCDLLKNFEPHEPVRVFSADVDQMFEVLGVTGPAMPDSATCPVCRRALRSAWLWWQPTLFYGCGYGVSLKRRRLAQHEPVDVGTALGKAVATSSSGPSTSP